MRMMTVPLPAFAIGFVLQGSSRSSASTCATASALVRMFGSSRGNTLFIGREFGMSELLFDVLAVECGTLDTSHADGSLLFVKKGMWAIESEFIADARRMLYDFNKLVLADCESKLFVAA